MGLTLKTVPPCSYSSSVQRFSIRFAAEAIMETSLRLAGGEHNSLRIHAKQKFPLDSNYLLQAHGEIDTGTGTPSCLALTFRRFLPELSTSIGLGVQLNKKWKLGYKIQAKISVPVTSNGMLGLNIKMRSDIDKDLQERKDRGAMELAWSILNFQKDQDVRLKVGCEMFEKVAYLQLRENNWTLNVDTNRRWNARYDL